MTQDRDLERVLERWLADGPARMPDRFFDTVIDRVDRTPQRRLAGLATRYLTMPSNTRLTAIAAAVVIAVVAIGAWALAGPHRSEVGGRPTASAASPTAPPSSSPSPSAPPIANGTYALAPMKVADLVAMINGDTKLSADDKTFLIDTAFAMKGGTTFNIWLDIDRGRFTERQAVDGVMNVGTQGTFTIPDDHTVIFNEQCACPPSTFQLTASGTSFTLHLLNPPTKEVDIVPVRTLWESGPFVRQP